MDGHRKWSWLLSGGCVYIPTCNNINTRAASAASANEVTFKKREGYTSIVPVPTLLTTTQQDDPDKEWSVTLAQRPSRYVYNKNVRVYIYKTIFFILLSK